jgi:thiol:disulfide interchange protein DsbA
MRLIKHLFAVLGFSLVALAASAAAPVEGVDYRTLDKAQPTESGSKVEVLEFFWYSCPHCYAFDPSLMEWVKKQGDNIVFKRVPIAFRDSFVPQQKLYYSLEAMGRLDDLHKKVFSAIHAERKRLDSEPAIIEFMVQQGVDKKKFLDVYNSFGVQTKVRRAAQLQEAYRVDGVPMIAINGRYVTAPSMVSARMRGQPENALHAATLEVMSALVTKAQAEGGGKK